MQRQNRHGLKQMVKKSFRKDLSMPGMLRVVRECFDDISDPVVTRGITLSDCLMLGLAVFSMKIPSLLRIDELIRSDADSVQAGNLKSLFGVKRFPSDSRLRERLDDVNPSSLRLCFKKIHVFLQRGKILENWTVLDGYYLISIDGTGYLSSRKNRCKNCSVNTHPNGSKTHYHKMLGAALIHPDHREVLPLAPEPIRQADGEDKNDCERNAAERLLDDLSREHPRLKAIIVESALVFNGHHITHLQNKDFRFILGAKPDDHELLFRWLKSSETKQSWATQDEATGTVHRFEWDSGIPLNDPNFDLEVNMLKYEETDKKGKTKQFSWVTDLPLDRDTVMLVMRAGRRCWALENRTARTPKTEDVYRFGHGTNHMADVFATLAILAFLIDQVQHHCCPLFRQARAHQKRNLYLWEKMHTLFENFSISDWRTFYLAMSRNVKTPELTDFFPTD